MGKELSKEGTKEVAVSSGFVLGLMSFNIFTNAHGPKIGKVIIKFADDAK